MKEVDPGHTYELTNYDGGTTQTLTFMKREGDNYPGNEGHYPGTNLQEVIRALIYRVRYLDNQVPCEENKELMSYLRVSLFHLERRAARRHDRILNLGIYRDLVRRIEDIPACTTCGHISCRGH